jgi:hypothetical protein
MIAKAKKTSYRTEAPKSQGTEIQTTENDQKRPRLEGLKERGGKAQRATVRRRRQGIQAVVLVLGLPESKNPTALNPGMPEPIRPRRTQLSVKAWGDVGG